MNKPSSNNKPTVIQPVNVGIYKPNGISSFWSWFTKGHKKVNLQNMMYDKKFGLKLNTKELNALKLNGIDLQKLQNIVANYNQTMQRNMSALSKDQSELNKNELLNNSVLYDLLTSKEFLNKTRNYKKSLVSSCTLSDKSKKNAINSKVTYIHTIKSKKSVANSVSSKASLKVGLKSSNNVNVLVNPLNRNILMTPFPEGLLKGNMKKKVFIPIYVGKKKTSKTNEGEKNTNVENKSDHIAANELTINPSRLTKFKMMEGQRSDTENTTNIINKAGSEKTVFKANNPSNTSKESPCQLINKGVGSHKMYAKRTSTKSKQKKIGLDNKSKKDCLSTSNKSSKNSKFSFDTTPGVKLSTSTNSYKDKIMNIRDILYNPENFIKHHNFIIPSNMSEKTLFEANPDVGCDVILKLFQALSEYNYSNNEQGGIDSQTKKVIRPMNIIDDINAQEQNQSGIKSGLRCDKQENYESVLSVSESQIDLINNCSGGLKKNVTSQKRNTSCPSSSTAVSVSYNNNAECLNQMHETLANEINIICNESNQIKIDNKDKSKLRKITSEIKSCMFVCKEELNDGTIETSRKDNYREKKKDDTDNTKNSLCSLNKAISLKLKKDDDKLQVVENNQDSKEFSLNTRVNNNELNLKLKENITLKKLNLQTAESQTEKQITNLPFAIDSGNICKIFIEQAKVSNPPEPSEDEIKGTKKMDSDTKDEPKFSITILVKNNLNDGVLLKKDAPTNSNETEKSPSLAVNDEEPSAMFEKDILLENEQDTTTRWRRRESNVNLNCNKIPPVKSQKAAITSTFTSLPASSFDDESSKEKYLNRNTDRIEIEEVAYLNQERRKMFDEQISNIAFKTKKSKEVTPVKIHPVANSSTDLKYECRSVRQLSESYLNPQKSSKVDLNNQSNRSYGKTSNNSVKSCIKTSYHLLKCLNFREEIDITSCVENTYNREHSRSHSVCIDKAIVRNNEECSSINNSTVRSNPTHSNVDYFVTVNKTLTAYDSQNKQPNPQDFFVINDENSKGGSSNGEASSSTNTKKRSYRYNIMTLKQEPIVNNPENSLLCDTLSIGDHQTKRFEMVSSEIVNCSTSIENLEKRSAILNPTGDETQITKYGDNLNKDVIKQSNVTLTSQPERLDVPDYELVSISEPKTPHCPSDGELNVNLTEHSNVTIHSQKEISVMPELHIPDTAKCGTCNLAREIIAKDDKLNENLTKNSNVKSSQSKRLGTSDYALVCLPVFETPKCCPCILAKINSTTSPNVHSQAEIFLEKTNQLMNEIKEINIICNSCMNKTKNLKSNFDPKSNDTAEAIRKKYNYQDVYVTEKKIKINSSSDTELESVNIKNQNTSEISNNDKLIRNNLQPTNNKNMPCSFSRDMHEEVLDIKPQNETTHGEDKKKTCYNNCLAMSTSSEDNIFSAITDTQTENTYCLDLSSNSDLSNKYNIDNGIIRYYIDRNEKYKLENLYQSTTDLDFNEEHKFPFCKTIPSLTPGNYKETVNDNCTSNNTEDRRDNHIKSSLNENYINEDIDLKRIDIQDEDQLKSTKSNFEVKNIMSDNVQTLYTSKAFFFDLARNNRQPHLTGKPTTREVKNEIHKSYKRNLLTTTKHNYLEKISHHRRHNFFPQAPSRGSSSPRCGVNCMHSTKYAVMRKTRTALTYSVNEKN